MSNLSNNQGRAYEFVCLNALYEEISKVRSAQIIQNSSFKAAQKAYNTLSDVEKIAPKNKWKQLTTKKVLSILMENPFRSK